MKLSVRAYFQGKKILIMLYFNRELSVLPKINSYVYFIFYFIEYFVVDKNYSQVGFKLKIICVIVWTFQLMKYVFYGIRQINMIIIYFVL